NNAGGSLSGSGNLNADIQISSGITTLTSDMTLNGDMYINTGTFTMTTHTLTCNGSWTNNGTFNSGTGTVILTGSSKIIAGSATGAFNNLTVQTGASYTVSPSANDVNVNGSFLHYGTSNIASAKYYDLYSSTAGSESILLDGTITATDVNDGIKDIDINNTVNMSGSGNITADVRIFGGTTTLTSGMTVNGGFEILSGAGFTMSTHTFSVESWKNRGTFTAGTGTVRFIGDGTRTVDANGNYSGSANAASDFYNVVVDRGSGSVNLTTKPMRVSNNFHLKNGTFKTGNLTDATGNVGNCRRLTVEENAIIDPSTTFFICYRKVCGSGSESLSPCGSSDSLYLPVFKGDLTCYGQIETERPIKSGFSDLKLTGARITGMGNPIGSAEFGVDIQPEDGTTATQVGDVSIEGDLIIQDPAANKWLSTDPGNTLNIGGSLYIYGSFEHNGTVNVYRNITSACYTSNTVTINQSTFNLYNDGGTTRFIYLDKDPMPFGTVNFMGAITREIRQNLQAEGDLSIEAGTLDMTTSTVPGACGGGNPPYLYNASINLSGITSFWINNSTFNQRSGTVTFSGSGTQYMHGSTATDFYNLTVNKGGSSSVVFGNSGTVSNQLTLTSGTITTTSNKLLTLKDQSSVSPTGGSATSYINGPLKKVGRDGAAGPYSFIFPVGKDDKWARLNLEHNSGTTATTDAFTVEYFNTGYDDPDVGNDMFQVTSPLNRGSGLEYWDITKNSGDVSLNKKIALYSEDKSWSEIDDFNNTDMTIAHWNNTTNKWEDIGNTANSGSGTSGWIKSDGTATFSPFTFASKSAVNTLPVELLFFDAKLRGDVVDVFWTTASEFNTDFFTVERSADSRNFEKVTDVKAAGLSATTLNYYAVDGFPYTGVSYYRLKVTDFDGSIVYSDIVTITYHPEIYEVETSLQMVNIFPNPTNGDLNIIFTTTEGRHVYLTIFDLQGRPVEEFSPYSSVPGENLLNLNVADYKPGIYILRLLTGENAVSGRFIKK
ncbi:MAG: T9SS type A sorting domain-containing protein, partial [Bacteroidetes bacterium]|nr:T9SS type A sorting domain-containing protein [Bacteroidota bacterium]